MVHLSIGTAGFFYKDWIGTFYPKQLEKGKYLEFFSRFFNIVEINSTFYNLPTKDMVINWNNSVPEEFRFIIKTWQQISHHIDAPDLDMNIFKFFSRLQELKPKIACFLIQFPPWFKYSESRLHKLEQLLEKIPSEYKYIIELRDNSWFDYQILSKFIDGENFILGTTYMPEITPFYLPNQKKYYVRMIGDRKLTIFNHIQRDQNYAVKHLIKNIKNLINIPNISEIFIIVNNHFQGFGPKSANNLKQKFGLPYRTFRDQKSLTDFLY
ncbi:MAG: DUF72 domain-containing protein [Promethearchaeota archaeon]|nr:MAG: DUF72 domain-containing protein [Candidatus Lokiarchaeota archaeon]